MTKEQQQIELAKQILSKLEYLQAQFPADYTEVDRVKVEVTEEIETLENEN